MKRMMTIILLILAFGLTATATARADGIIIPEPPICRPPCPIPPPPPRETPYLSVETHRVNVTIDNQVATTRVDQTFRNDSDWSLEGTYIFPLPEEAAISDFAMWIDGEKVEGQLHTKEEARRIYDNIVRRRLDPALLEYVGRDLFQASIFPIDPGDSRRIEIEYSQILPVDNGLVQYVYPLSTERFSNRPLEDVSVAVEIQSRQPIKAIYSPSHPVSIDREGRFNALVGWEDAQVKPDTDFSLYYTVSAEDVGVNLLSYKEGAEDGFFALLIAPNVDAEQVVDKDVILVLDVSGSMEGEKMAQARDALKFVLDHLNEEDRFNIIAFSTGVSAFSSRPEPLSALPEARRFVDDLAPGGSTDINRALLEALEGADSERPTIIIFLTDGLPTSGTVETPLILNNIDQAAASNLRIFPFGVGDDVDTLLLDTLAQQQRGASAYVRPGERVDEQVSNFYAKVSTPVLADVSLEIEGVQLEDTYPFPLPDLFAGTQLVVAGRYREGGPASATLSGDVNGQNRSFRFDDLTFTGGSSASTFPDSGRQEAFIPRLWATRKIGHLLNQIRLHGEERELIDEIVDLSVRYGIITPYTSFLVEEPELALRREGRSIIVEEEFAAAEEEADEATSGSGAVDRAVAQNALADAEMAAPPPGATPSPSDAPAPEAGQESQALAGAAVTAVGDKAFVLRDGVWTDTTFDPDLMTTTTLPFPSDRFLTFLAEQPRAGQYFALGSRVIVVLDGVAYETVEGEVEDMPDPLEIEPESPPDPTMPAPASDPEAEPVTSPPPAAAGEVYLTLTADAGEGQAPLEVNLSGELIGAEEEIRDYYCAASTFDFGDGSVQTVTPTCPVWQEGLEVRRQYTANYLYEEPGAYEVTFSLDSARSEPVTIIVTDPAAEEEIEPATEEDEPASAQTPPESEPDTAAEAETTNQSGGSNCVAGVLGSSILGLVIVQRRKRNTRSALQRSEQS